MAKISDLPILATTDVDGTEWMPVVKAGVTRRTSGAGYFERMAAPYAEALAEVAADIAFTAQRYYPTIADGVAATVAPNTFISDQTGTLTWYNAAGTPIGIPATRSMVDALGKQLSRYSSAAGALATGGAFAGGGGSFALAASLSALSVTAIDYATLTAASPVSLTLGGSVDTGTTITPAQTAVPAGAREFGYTELTGPLAAGDWVVLSGHLPGAWTDNSGRNVLWSAMMQVRAVDTANMVIKLHQSIPYGLDAQTVSNNTGTDTLYAISAAKVLPKRVDLSRLKLRNVSVTLRYVIDSNIDADWLDSESSGVGLVLEWATNCRGNITSRARNTNQATQNIQLNWIYGCDFNLTCVAASPSPSVGTPKAVRGRSWTASRINILATDVGMAVCVVEGIIGGSVDVVAVGPGVYNLDNNITTENRNDTVHLQFGRGARLSATVQEPDCTGVEFFNAVDCDCRASVTRRRATPTNEALVNIKGICCRSRFDVFVRVFGDPTASGVKMEFGDNNALAGGYQRDLTLNVDVENDSGIGVYARFPNAPGMSVDTVITGHAKARSPITIDPEIAGFEVSGSWEVAAGGTHAIVVQSAPNIIRNSRMTGTSGTARRAVASTVLGNIIENCASDGGVFNELVASADGFNLNNYRNLNQRVLLANQNISFYPSLDGGWSIVGVSEAFDAVAAEWVLPLTVGTWAPGDVLHKYQAARGETGWRWDGTYWRRDAAKTLLGPLAYNLPPIAALGYASFDIPMPGARVRDMVNIACSLNYGDLIVSGRVSANDVVTVTVFNPTSSAVDVTNATYYAIVEKWNNS